MRSYEIPSRAAPVASKRQQVTALYHFALNVESLGISMIPLKLTKSQLPSHYHPSTESESVQKSWRCVFGGGLRIDNPEL